MAYDLATTQLPKLLAQPDQVVLLLVSGLNSDGQLREVKAARSRPGQL